MKKYGGIVLAFIGGGLTAAAGIEGAPSYFTILAAAIAAIGATIAHNTVPAKN